MGSILQNKDGRLIDTENVTNINKIIQLVQLSNGPMNDIFELKKDDKLVCFLDNKISYETISSILYKKCRNFIFLKLKNGFFILIPEKFKLITTIDADITYKNAADLKVGDFLATPRFFKTKSTKISFNPWNLDNHLYVVGANNWYLKKINEVIKNKKLILKDIANELKVKYWMIRRNPSSKSSINYGYLKNFIKKYIGKNKIYEMLDYSKGLKNEKSATKFAKVPFRYNDELAYLDAVMVGEGHIVNNEKQAIFEFSDKNYTNLIKNMFFDVHAYRQKGLRINLPGFLAYFYHRFLGIPKGAKSEIVKFPPLSLLSEDKIMLSAIRGIIDGEGNVNTKNCSITVTSSSFKLILGLSSALLRIGVVSSIKKSNKDSTWILSIYRGNLNKLIKNIKYLKHHKKNKEIMKLKKMNFTERRIIPNIGNYLRNSRKKLNISYRQFTSNVGLSSTLPMEKIGNFSYESLIKINRVLKDKKIDKLLKTDLNWHKIICKKEINVVDNFVFPKTKGFFLLNNIFVRGD